MKSSEALKKVRELIESGEVTHICNAFPRVKGGNTRVARRINAIFANQEYSTIGAWLRKNSPEAAKELAGVSWEGYNTILRSYRLAWIDWLIPQYEEIGD